MRIVRKTIGSLLLLTMTSFIAAQDLTQQEAAKKYGEGTTIHTSKTTDEALNETTIIEYRDKDGIVRRREEIKTDLSRKRLYKKVTEHTLSGRITRMQYTTYPTAGRVNNEGNGIYSITETKEYDRKGRLTSHKVESDGWNYGNDQPRTTSYDVMQGTGTKPSADWVPLRQSEIDGPGPVSQEQSCLPRPRIFIGYSYLNADFGVQRESFPLGVNATVEYALNNSLSVVGDFSTHRKMIGDQLWRQMYLGIGVQYNFNKSGDCSKNPQGFVNITGGYSRESCRFDGEKIFSEGGLAFMGGGGVRYSFNNTIGVQVQTHAIVHGFQTEETRVSIRASGGVSISNPLGKKPRKNKRTSLLNRRRSPN